MAVISVQTLYLWLCGSCGTPVCMWIPSRGWEEPSTIVVLNCQDCNEPQHVSAGVPGLRPEPWMPAERIRVKPPYGRDGADVGVGDDRHL